jgi:peptide/nickel transport system permease protein
MTLAGGATADPQENDTTVAQRRRAPLLRFFLRRLAGGILTLLVATMLIFAATDLLPGSPASNALGKFATPEQTRALNQKLGYDHPLPVRYYNWLKAALHGDLGDSAVGTANAGVRAPIWPLVHDRLLNTLTLALTSAILLVPLALLFGTIAALRAGRLTDHTISTALLATISLPEFVTGTLLVLIFFKLLGWLPPNSFIAPGSPAIHHPTLLVLPVVTLLAASVAWAARLVRAGVIETLTAEYVQAARLNGLPEGRIVLHYALRNALAPSVQVLAVSIQALFGGVIVTEVLFSYPGLGAELVNAVQGHDTTLVQGIALLIAAVYILINVVADVVVVALLPRLRTEI